MRKIVATALITLLVAAPGAAFAASATTGAMAKTTAGTSAMSAAATPQTITSTVKGFNLNSHTLTLANGVSYVLPANFNNPGLRIGEKVNVKYQVNGKTYDATSVTLG